jgi:tRNA (uracil-5-)-methyltransferase
MQEHTGISNAAPPSAPFEVLAGAEHIHEELLGLRCGSLPLCGGPDLTGSGRFRISATAFFQVNTLATEVLYSLVRDWCAAEPDSTVLGAP